VVHTLCERSGNPSLGEEYFAVRFFSARYDRCMKIPPIPHRYFYTGALVASGILLVVGIVLFWAAVSFEGYLLACIALALAGCGFTGAQELKPQGLAALTPEDAGSSPGSAA